MPPVVVAKVTTPSTEVRDKAIERLLSISKFSQEQEPTVSKYAVFVPQDTADDKSYWVIEEYADKATFDAHMSTPIVKDMISWMTTDSVVSGAPQMHMLNWIDSTTFTKFTIKSQSNPYVCFAELEYHPGKIPESLPFWKEVCRESEEDEPGTHMWGILEDAGKQDWMYSLEAYESKEYLWDVHAKSKAVAENVKNTKDMRVSLKHNMLRLVGGFLCR